MEWFTKPGSFPGADDFPHKNIFVLLGLKFIFSYVKINHKLSDSEEVC